MDVWRTVLIAILASINSQAMAYDVKNPVERTFVITTFIPTMLLGGTTALTMYGPSSMKSAKADALAFIGSDGEIRGAQFEQAVLYYHSAYDQPHMTDEQLALAIATSL